MNAATCPCERCAAKRERYVQARAQLLVGDGVTTLEGRELALEVVIGFQRHLAVAEALQRFKNC
jgi:hypothetical protein